MHPLLLAGAVSLVAAAALVGALIPGLQRFAMDIPVERSSHATPVPRGAGVAVLAAMLLGAASVEWLGGSPEWTVMASAGVLGLVGFWEDVHRLAVPVRLLLQLLVALGVSLMLVQWPSTSPLLIVCAASVLLVGYVNAFNFMDGINAISALSMILAMAWFALLGVRFDVPGVTAIAVCGGAAALGFLPWNAPQARVFLGDSGSYGFGMTIGSAAVALWSEGVPMLAVLAPLTIYFADTGWTLLSRLLRGSTWHEAHREHVYQRLTTGRAHLPVAILVTAGGATICAAWWYLGDESTLGFLVVATGVSALYLSLPTLRGRA